MKDYSQPDFYKFNEDSIELVNLVTSEMKDILTPISLLDMGAGCGVLGYEVSRKIVVSSLSLLEYQEEFIPFIKKNECFSRATSIQIVSDTFSRFYPTQTYSLIVSNPPFYNKENFRVSPNLNRSICRAFMVDSFSDWLNCLLRSLSSNGTAFFVIDCSMKSDLLSLIEDKAEVRLLKEKKDSLFFYLRAL